MAAVLALSLVGCGWWFRDTGLVGLARTLSHSTTLAHRYLVAGFDATAAPEDAVDQALLAEVMELDEADEHLSRDIGRLQQLPPSDDHGALRAEIPRSLDQIDAD